MYLCKIQKEYQVIKKSVTIYNPDYFDDDIVIEEMEAKWGIEISQIRIK